MTTFTPTTAQEVLNIVRWAAAEETPLEILGHGSKRGIGRPVQTEHVLDLSQLSGITLYEPEELVLSAKAGTPISEIEGLLAEHNQQFAFEPMDYGPLLGGESGRGTIGGMLGANLSGPRRIKAGAARRSCARRVCRLRARRGVQVRRARGEERHRLRSFQGTCRLLGHARGRHGCHFQGAARGGNGKDARSFRPR